MITDQIEQQTPANTSVSGTWSLARYLLVILAIPVLLYPLPFFLVRIHSYPVWSGVPGDAVFDFAFKAAGQNADVVIFGESTANHGIVPSKMSEALGVKVLSLPGTYGMFLADGDLPLRHYMQFDKPPQVVVLYLAAWHMDYSHEDIRSTPPYDGMEAIVRYGTNQEKYAFAKKYPLLAMQFPLMFYEANLSTNILRLGLKRELLQQAIRTNGYTDMNGYVYDKPSCVIPADIINRIRFDTARQIIAKYATSQTKVLVYAAPIPDCMNSAELVQRCRKMLPIAPPKILPAPLFLDDEMYAHLHSVGVDDATQDLIQAVRPLLQHTNITNQIH